MQLIVGFMKKTLYKISQYFPKPYEPFAKDINLKVVLSNYATKSYLKKAILALESNIAKLKAEIGKIDIDKLKTVRVGFK